LKKPIHHEVHGDHREKKFWGFDSVISVCSVVKTGLNRRSQIANDDA
jgi:hypothetical protein